MTPVVSLSIYVHTPYCLQRCRYCDFTTFEATEIYRPEKYFNDLFKEIEQRNSIWKERQLNSLYFGGGTPSLVDPELIISTLKHLANVGFEIHPTTEITIEINPATLTEKSLDQYLSAGINRFSVGAQTFDDTLLKNAGRKHDANDTRQTLQMLNSRDLNYSFDLLFALPHQTLSQLQKDLDEILDWAPPHLSTYCLTVPEGHPMSFHRPLEEVQVEMFSEIESQLKKIHLFKYELSNFSRPGFESVHNFSYWNDRPYWGVGLSSHSYDPRAGEYGTRFWNTKSIKAYPSEVQRSGDRISDFHSEDQREELKLHEAMTDLCHMYLRTLDGLPLAALQKFPKPAQTLIEKNLLGLVEDQLLKKEENHWRLTPEGELKSNLIYARLTFLKEDLPSD
tara:strand:+ start:185293 stop:186474 length:1182 start_codon:yes stop_codon:yes gene_type:complete